MGWNRYKLASWFCIASLLTALGQAAASERQPEEPFTPLQQNIETLRQEHQIPGASIAVIDDGQIAWARGFGLADLASGRPVTADTLFQAQSITKTLTALATVKLLAAEEIALDEPVNRYLKGWTIPNNDYTAAVRTLRTLCRTSTAHPEYSDNLSIAFRYISALPPLV